MLPLELFLSQSQFNDFSKNATGWDWNFGDGINSTAAKSSAYIFSSRKLYRNIYGKQFKWHGFSDKKYKCSQKRNGLEPFDFIQQPST